MSVFLYLSQILLIIILTLLIRNFSENRIFFWLLFIAYTVGLAVGGVSLCCHCFTSEISLYILALDSLKILILKRSEICRFSQHFFIKKFILKKTINLTAFQSVHSYTCFYCSVHFCVAVHVKIALLTKFKLSIFESLFKIDWFSRIFSFNIFRYRHLAIFIAFKVDFKILLRSWSYFHSRLGFLLLCSCLWDTKINGKILYLVLCNIMHIWAIYLGMNLNE